MICLMMNAPLARYRKTSYVHCSSFPEKVEVGREAFVVFRWEPGNEILVQCSGLTSAKFRKAVKAFRSN